MQLHVVTIVISEKETLDAAASQPEERERWQEQME